MVVRPELLSYHRIISPAVQIPTESFTPVPVGLLACQRDPLLEHLQTNVITWTPSQGLDASKDKKKKVQLTESSAQLYEVLLQDTILFPEGGGQPSDIGVIKGQGGTTWDVLEVKRRGGHAIHYVKGIGAAAPLDPGVCVTVSLGEEGFKRRYDHMCMHTCQHLISALLETRLNCPTPSWYLTQSPNPAYIEIPRALSAEDLKAVEEAANDCCLRGTRIHIEVEELHAIMRENGDRNSSKNLPADYTGGVNRTVIIEGIDRNPCCGTHLPTLQGLSVFVLPQVELLSRGRARVFFCAGPRLRTYLSQTHGLLTTAASSYGCSPAQVPERLAFETDSRRKSYKRTEELENEVARFIVEDLQNERANWVPGGTKSRFTAFRHRHDTSSNPLSILSSIHSEWSSCPSASGPHLIVLVSSSSHAPSSSAVILIFGSDEREVKDIGDKLKSRGIKGGGKGKWSGKVDDWRAIGGDEWIRDLVQPSTLSI